MLTGNALISATRKYAKEDRNRSWLLLLGTISLWLVALVGACYNFNLVLQLFCGVVAGLVTVRLFIIYHDYMHKSILQGSWLAELIFTVFGWYILAPKSIWRRSHDYHHAHNAKLYTSSIGSFPIVTKEEFLNAPKSERRVYLFIRHPFTIALGYIFAFIWGMCIRSFLSKPGVHKDSMIALVFHALLGAAIYYFCGWPGLLIGFFMPYLISLSMGSYLFYAQHNFPGVKFKNKQEWDFVYAALYSSSYMKMSGLMHWFTGNIGYHHIHHINAKIPFYNLPKVFTEMKEFQSPTTTSLNPKDVFRCLNVKVWDPEKDKMIGIKEVYA